VSSGFDDGKKDAPARRSALRGAVDFGHLTQYTGGDTAIEDELLELFVSNAGRYLGLMDAATDAQSWRDAAHGLMGSARGIGAWVVAETAQQAHEADPTADRARRTMIARLRKEIAAVRKTALARQMSRPAP